MLTQPNLSDPEDGHQPCASCFCVNQPSKDLMLIVTFRMTLPSTALWHAISFTLLYVDGALASCVGTKRICLKYLLTECTYTEILLIKAYHTFHIGSISTDFREPMSAV